MQRSRGERSCARHNPCPAARAAGETADWRQSGVLPAVPQLRPARADGAWTLSNLAFPKLAMVEDHEPLGTWRLHDSDFLPF